MGAAARGAARGWIGTTGITLDRAHVLHACRVLAFALASGLLAACGGGAGSEEDDTAPAGVGLQTFGSAGVVVGQAVFTGQLPNRAGTAPGPDALHAPRASALGGLFIADTGNNRVLAFEATPVFSNLSATFVLGQPDFDFSDPNVGSTGMFGPECAVTAGDALYVSDSGNNRVLIWHGLPDTRGAPANVVVGQPDMVSRAPGTSALSLHHPAGLSVAGDCLVVADRDNHRVLVWKGVPAVDHTPADLVLGQVDMSAFLPNRGAAPDADTLSDPVAVWTDGTRLAVADRGNNRVLVWTAFPTQSGQPADLVLGQPDFRSAVPGAGASGLHGPADVTWSGPRFCVADAANNRILVWEAFPVASRAPADTVLGQGDFVHVAPNDDDQDGQQDPQPSARTLRSLDGALSVRAFPGLLVVGDTGNHRVLLFYE